MAENHPGITKHHVSAWSSKRVSLLRANENKADAKYAQTETRVWYPACEDELFMAFHTVIVVACTDGLKTTDIEFKKILEAAQPPHWQTFQCSNGWSTMFTLLSAIFICSHPEILIQFLITKLHTYTVV